MDAILGPPDSVETLALGLSGCGKRSTEPHVDDFQGKAISGVFQLPGHIVLEEKRWYERRVASQWRGTPGGDNLSARFGRSRPAAAACILPHGLREPCLLPEVAGCSPALHTDAWGRGGRSPIPGGHATMDRHPSLHLAPPGRPARTSGAVHSCTNTHIAAIRAAARRKIVRRACSRARAFLHALACSNSRAPSETNCSSSLIPGRSDELVECATEDGCDWPCRSKTNFS